MKIVHAAAIVGLLAAGVLAARPTEKLYDRYADSGMYPNVVQLDDGSIVEMSTTTVGVILKVLVASDGTIVEPLPSVK